MLQTKNAMGFQREILKPLEVFTGLLCKPYGLHRFVMEPYRFSKAFQEKTLSFLQELQNPMGFHKGR